MDSWGGVKEGVLYKRADVENHKVCLGDKKEFNRIDGKKKRVNMSVCIKSLSCSERNAQPLSKPASRSTRGVGNHAVMTPTTIAANAPRALKTFLDPPLLLLLLLLAELEGFEPLEVLLGVPEELPEPGVAEASG